MYVTHMMLEILNVHLNRIFWHLHIHQINFFYCCIQVQAIHYMALRFQMSN